LTQRVCRYLPLLIRELVQFSNWVPYCFSLYSAGGKLCTFSPCIEQVQKTCEALKKSSNFISITTQEVLQRPLSVQNRSMTLLDFTPIEPVKGVKLEPIKKEQVKFRSLVSPTVMPGHTGYITFATFIPSAAEEVTE